jgi:hypothetical protein
MTTNQVKDEKYRLYSLSVQNPEFEVAFVDKVYSSLNGRRPSVVREDFCGAFLNSCAWVRKRKTNLAIALDIDPEPLGYGYRNNLSQLSEEQKSRLTVQSDNVLTVKTKKADVICAVNFSYCCFKDRSVLLDYFRKCRANLRPKGILLIDSFGGPANLSPHKDVIHFSKHGFKYFWEMESYDYVNCNAKYAIHFKPERKPMMRRAFTYDWRIWSIPELRDIMREAGFKKTQVMIEGTNRRGVGDGKYRTVKSSTESCETWLAYIVGIQ